MTTASPHHHQAGVGEKDPGQDLHLGLQRRCGEREPVGAERQPVDLLGGDEEPDGCDEGHERRTAEQRPGSRSGTRRYRERRPRAWPARWRAPSCRSSFVTMTPTYPPSVNSGRVRDVQDAQQSVDEGEGRARSGRRSRPGRGPERSDRGRAWIGGSPGQVARPSNALAGIHRGWCCPAGTGLPAEVCRCSATLCMNGPALRAGPFIAYHSSGGASSTGSEMTA